MTAVKFLSILIPLFNEEESIPLLKQELDCLLVELSKRNLRYEILLVNDGSVDNTENKLNEYFS